MSEQWPVEKAFRLSSWKSVEEHITAAQKLGVRSFRLYAEPSLDYQRDRWRLALVIDSLWVDD